MEGPAIGIIVPRMDGYPITSVLRGIGEVLESKMELVIRVYNDGLAFRYRFPEGKDSLVVKE